MKNRREKDIFVLLFSVILSVFTGLLAYNLCIVSEWTDIAILTFLAWMYWALKLIDWGRN